jgi:phage tail P2-like protein
MFAQSLIPSFENENLHSVDVVNDDISTTLLNEIKAFKNLANPETCEAKYLPFLAYAFKVDFWDDNLTESDKRNLIKSSLLLHQRKGTVWAIERIFESLDMEASLSEWFNYDGEPYHFRVDIIVSDMDRRISAELFADLKKYIDIYKNVRSVLDEFSIKLKNSTGKIEVAGAGTLSAKLANELNLDYQSFGSIEFAGANVINTKLSNDFIQDDKTIAINTTGGGVIDVKLSNDVGINYPLTDIKIQGAGIWTI